MRVSYIIASEATSRAAYGLSKEIDTFLFGKIASEVAPAHDLPEATLASPTEAYEALVDYSVLLDEADAPEQGRFVVVNPGFHGLLLRDDRFIAAGDQTGAGVRANGVVGSAAGFQIMKSNNLAAFMCIRAIPHKKVLISCRLWLVIT